MLTIFVCSLNCVFILFVLFTIFVYSLNCVFILLFLVKVWLIILYSLWNNIVEINSKHLFIGLYTKENTKIFELLISLQEKHCISSTKNRRKWTKTDEKNFGFTSAKHQTKKMRKQSVFFVGQHERRNLHGASWRKRDANAVG